MVKSRYLTAQEAAEELGVSLPTLYAYVSRGLIHSESAGGSGRNRRYHLEDIEKLKARKEVRRNPTAAADSALHWGAPVIETAITLIEDGHLYYRGLDAIDLAKSHSVEEIAALIWTGHIEDAEILFHGHIPEISPIWETICPHLDNLTPLERLQLALPLAAANDLAAYDLRPSAVAQTGARILAVIVGVLTGQYPSRTDIARTLQAAWAPDDPLAAHLLNAALVVCADHELNVSSFTARCVASGGSTPYAVVIAGLAALQGAKHGGLTERVEAFFREAGTPDSVRPAIAGRLKRGESLPGFGNRFYPEGDPRGRLLVDLVTRAHPHLPEVELATAIVDTADELMDEHPTVDFGLAALASALKLPEGAALALFALGHTIGWIGQAIEQYRIDTMIRPRARYIGDSPNGEN
ncbi:MAG: citrate synthase family protein [Anaerolineae bacterium]|nr:citrate synthase family protein [Anaerolineae bacterium]